ncbi:nose resistant to fluoxetine protein 6-like [Centruroides sculpturatus]|uniref:nose resistant to fluoxetine protein 6-like n=1 Tax=Centruroides sculpturatus TaxID=218467 RepID=UPI000C6DB5EB|nr:nose resistant to fluoxetine protein 6-like [Centruroides sculpturatus]
MVVLGAYNIDIQEVPYSSNYHLYLETYRENPVIDSFGKLPAGMLEIRQWISGDYDQCLDIEIPQNKREITDKGNKQIRGKYCALTIGMQESLKRIAKSIHKFENNSLIKLAKEFHEVPYSSNYHLYLETYRENQVIDSFGKLPAGMLEIRQWISGDYDQCLDIEIPQNKKEITDKGNKQIRGKYCALTIGMQESLKRIAKYIHKFENNSLIKLAKEFHKPMKFDDLLKTELSYTRIKRRLDVCIPSTCSNEDLKNIGNWIFGTAVDFNVEYCKIKDERIEYSTGQLISLIVLGIFIAWVALATLIEILMRLHIIPLKASKGRFFEYILGASPYKSLHKLYSTNLDESTKWMCGVKFLLVNIVVLGHVCIIGLFYPTFGDKYTNIFKHVDLLLYEIILQGFTIMESFFFCNGFMVMYLRQKSGRNSAKYYIMFLVKRVIRYTLPIFFVLGFAILLPLLGEGPHWDIIISQAKHMENEWWKYITHIHIYLIGGSTVFIDIIWFMSVLVQLSILMSLLLYIVDR